MFISIYDSDLEMYVSVNTDKINMYYESNGNNYKTVILNDSDEIIVRTSFTKQEIDDMIGTKHYKLKVNDSY